MLKSRSRRTLAYIEVDSRGVHRITDHRNRVLGYYDPRTNRTTDRRQRLVGYGYLLPKLLPDDLAEEGGTGAIQPKKPLTPEQMRRASESRSKVSQDMSAENKRHTDRMRNLRDKLANT